MQNNLSTKKENEVNKFATHPLQSYEWGIFREKTGVKVVRGKNFQLTIHKIPHTPWNIGYLPKGPLPTKEMIEELFKIGKENKCIFIQIEPNIEKDKGLRIKDKNEKKESNIVNASSFIINHLSLIPSAHPLFTKYTLVLDLTKTEEQLLAAMHPKTRYNIKVAQKHGVKIVEDNSDNAFEEYWKLMEETTKRQEFYAHTKRYHELMFETLKKPVIKKIQDDKNHLYAHLFLAKYKGIVLTAWVLFTFKDTLYYPYGASSREHRDVMAQNLMMWEAIKFGKKLGLKKFDLWGSLGPNPNPNDPWYGFHRFKLGYNPKLVEFIGSYDLIINPFAYQLYKIADKIRWILLKLKK